MAVRAGVRWKVLVVLALAAAAACGNETADEGVSVQGRAPRATEGIAVDVLHRGSGGNGEPEPRGTLRVDGPPDRAFWVQAISREGYEAFRAADGSDGGGAERRPAEGVRQVVVENAGAYRLVGAFGSNDPAEVADQVWDLDALPAGMSFHRATGEATTGATFDPAVDPPEVLADGVYLVEVMAGTRTMKATVVPGGTAGLVGLIGNVVQLAPGVFVGEMAEGRAVGLVGAADASFSVVLTDPPDGDWLVVSRSRLMSAVSDAI